MFKNILVAIDGSDHSKQAIPAAIEVAKKFDSEVFVLHVSEHDRGYPVAFSSESPADAAKLVLDAVATLRHAGVTASGEVHDVAVGHVARDLVETARSKSCDLIVMGSRGLSDVQGLLLGSVTHKVIQLSHVAVLVTRATIPVKRTVAQPTISAQLVPAL